MVSFAFVALFDHVNFKYVFFDRKDTHRKNNADWCKWFVQNPHGEPIGDKTDSCQICNLARGEVSEMPPTK